MSQLFNLLATTVANTGTNSVHCSIQCESIVLINKQEVLSYAIYKEHKSVLVDWIK